MIPGAGRAVPMKSVSIPAMIRKQRALARAVAADHADLGARVERQPDVLEDVFLAVGLGEVFDGEDVLRRHEVSLGRSEIQMLFCGTDGNGPDRAALPLSDVFTVMFQARA